MESFPTRVVVPTASSTPVSVQATQQPSGDVAKQLRVRLPDSLVKVIFQVLSWINLRSSTSTLVHRPGAHRQHQARRLLQHPTAREASLMAQ